MIEFLTTGGVGLQLENLIRGAQNRLVLISPYIRISTILFESLREADRRSVKTILLHKGNKLEREDSLKLTLLTNLTLGIIPNLHARCYLNENMAIVSSMSLYEFPEQNNLEMGFLINASSDPEVYIKIKGEVDTMLNLAVTANNKSSVNTQEKPPLSNNQQQKPALSIQKGYCIRCGAEVPYNPEIPFCASCFAQWSNYANFNYLEKFCHLCGRATTTSALMPRCSLCYES
jgi:hypothetical protein